MSLERVDSVDPTEVYDYIICGYVHSMPLESECRSSLKQSQRWNIRLCHCWTPS